MKIFLILNAIFITFFLWIIPVSYAQKTELSYEAKIQRIDINNSTIKSCIHAFIKKQKELDKTFENGYGYIRLSNIEYGDLAPINFSNSSEKKKSDFADPISLSFHVSLSSIFLEEIANSNGINDYYPPFYTYVDGVIVLIYIETYHVLTSIPGKTTFSSAISSYQNKSKRKLRRLILSYLKKALDEDFVFVDIAGKSFTLSIADREQLTDIEILRRATFNMGYASKFQLTRSGKILESEIK